MSQPPPLSKRLAADSGRLSGITLIELSIVLVIIGLIVGGVMAGKEMIRTAELRNVISDIDSFKTSMNAFKLKYNCLPGDCVNATNFLSSTANGNGDSAILITSAPTAGPDESTRFWEHLSKAQLIDGNYTWSGNSGDFGPGRTGPAAGINASGYRITNLVALHFGKSGHIIWIMKDGGNGLQQSAISPLDSYTIDGKIDDGKATSGRVLGVDGRELSGAAASVRCNNAPEISGRDYSNIEGSGDYVLTNSSPACRTFFMQGF